MLLTQNHCPFLKCILLIFGVAGAAEPADDQPVPPLTVPQPFRAGECSGSPELLLVPLLPAGSGQSAETCRRAGSGAAQVARSAVPREI